MIGEILEHLQFAQRGEFLVFVDFQIAFFEVAECGQFVAEVAPGGKTIRRVFLQGEHHDALQLRRQVVAQLCRRQRLFVQDLLVQMRQIFRRIRRMPGEQAVHHDAQRIDVGLVRDLVAAHLFRRHVIGRADAVVRLLEIECGWPRPGRRS